MSEFSFSNRLLLSLDRGTMVVHCQESGDSWQLLDTDAFAGVDVAAMTDEEVLDLFYADYWD